MRPLKVAQSITNRETVSLEKYLQEISKLEMVSPEQEAVLSSLIQSGDEAALSSLTKANLRFVVSVAKQYQYRGLSVPDLINEGNIGLIRAAKCYDATKGFKFISYAVWWIRQSIIQAINDKGQMVRLPSNRAALRNRVRSGTARLEQELERTPSFDEISQYLGMSATEVEQSSLEYAYHRSLDTPVSNENTDVTLIDLLPAGTKDDSDKNSLSVELERCLASLPPLQQTILCCFYGIGRKEPMSLESIGKQLNLSSERVRQIRQRAVATLKDGKRAALLKPFLG